MISAKTDQVTGEKYMSVKMLLDLSVDVRDFLMSQISLYGFDGCGASKDMCLQCL